MLFLILINLFLLGIKCPTDKAVNEAFRIHGTKVVDKISLTWKEFKKKNQNLVWKLFVLSISEND